MVLVVWFLVVQSHLKDLADNTAEEDSLLLSVFRLVTQVREEFTVEKLVNTCFSVFLLLSSCEFLLQPLIGFRLALDFELFVVVDFVDVGNDELECLLWTGDSGKHFLVVFDTEGTHEENNRNRGGSSSANLDHEHTISALFDGERLTHTVLLREDLCNFCSLCGSLVNFNRYTVWCKVFHRDENTLGSVDNEVATWVERVFALVPQKVGKKRSVFRRLGRLKGTSVSDVAWVEVAPSRANHDWDCSDLDTFFRERGDTVAVDGEVDGDW